ncbi:MAG: hypothetical protein Q7T11_03385, partial [Deltaproteobacteria bacterium]|nr:hypothetical protein [Deltaproteobacteria bacterium]
MRFLSIILFGFLGLAACGGSTDTAEEEEEDSTSTNSLAVTFPDDLAVSSLTAATEGTTSLNALIRMQTTEDLVPQNFVEKKEEMATLLNP